MAYLKRHMESRILELSRSWPAILLTGPRQAGKTTMLQKLAQQEGINREYVSLDDLSLRDLAKNDPKLFFQLHKLSAPVITCKKTPRKNVIKRRRGGKKIDSQ